MDKTVLPGNALKSLYKNALYHNNDRPGLHSDKSQPYAIPFLGNNSKKVLLIVRFDTEAFLPERHLGFIAKMLSACNMNIGDVAIVNDKTEKYRLDSLYDQIRPLHIILFGINPRELGLPIDLPSFTITLFKDCQVFHTPSLDALNQETPEAIAGKKQLWGCLRQAFSL